MSTQRPQKKGKSTKPRIRVLIVDDSALARAVTAQALRDQDDIEIVGMANDGAQAVTLATTFQPDVVTMDIHMPTMDGIAATRKITNDLASKVIIISSSVESNPRLVFQAMEVGAVDALQKPVAPHMTSEMLSEDVFITFRDQLARKIRAAAHASRRTLRDLPADAETASVSSCRKIVGIGTSTGGPVTICTLLENLPKDFTPAIVIVQHIDGGFLAGLAEWLTAKSNRPVLVARNGEALQCGAIRIAPADLQTRVGPDGRIHTVAEGQIGGFQPSATALLESLAEWGSRAAGVILTGMGKDGVDGLKKMREAGCWTIAQDEQTSVVYGMPRIAAETGAAERILPLDRIPDALAQWAKAPAQARE